MSFKFKNLSENRKHFLRTCKYCEDEYLIPIAGNGYSDDYCTQTCHINKLEGETAELKKWLENEIKYNQTPMDWQKGFVVGMKTTLNKMKELKEATICNP